jgi:hypothetical protein
MINLNKKKLKINKFRDNHNLGKENKLISFHDPQKIDGKLLKIVKEYLFEKHGIIKMLRFFFFGIHVFMLNNIQKKIPKDFATKVSPLTYNSNVNYNKSCMFLHTLVIGTL